MRGSESCGKVSWTKCITTKAMQCTFCTHIHSLGEKNWEGYPNIYVGDKIGEDFLKELVRYHMKIAHPRIKVCYDKKLWGRV